jgi:penicillin-binding protein 2
MEGCLTNPLGTAHLPGLAIPGVRIAGKTGTATVMLGDGKGKIDIAWFICFAPVEHPRIALAVAVQGDVPNEGFGGGREAAPIALSVLRKYFEKTGTP